MQISKQIFAVVLAASLASQLFVVTGAFAQASGLNGRPAIDHTAWQAILDKYLASSHPSGVSRFAYGAVTTADQAKLEGYLQSMSQLRAETYSRAEYMAYWINVYNAVTVQLVVDAYPVDSIKRVKGGWFNRGPWDQAVFPAKGRLMSLNDIEHGILRTEFKDPRIHYAVNCASIGCPNLASQAYSGEILNQQLNDAAVNFINHPRGVRIDQDQMQLSSIFDWYADDFGSSEAALLEHLKMYAEPELGASISEFRGRIKYGYNWDLNDAR